MRMSDWSSDVCSSDLWRATEAGTGRAVAHQLGQRGAVARAQRDAHRRADLDLLPGDLERLAEREQHRAPDSRRLRGRPDIGQENREFVARQPPDDGMAPAPRPEGHTSEPHALMRISYASSTLKKKKPTQTHQNTNT